METVSTAAQDDSSGANPSSVKSDDSSPRHESGRGSPPPNCAICLGTCRNKSFTDSCLHQFCFKCLLTWSRVKAVCPLCKQNFRSIIHNVRSNHQYEEYMVEQRQTEETIDRLDFDNLAATTRRFRYRTTLTLPRRETIAIQQLLLQHYPIMANMFPEPVPRRPIAPRTVPQRRRRSPNTFRRTVYRHNLWARPLPDFTGRFRDCSPEFYRYNDSQMHRLVPWLNRDLHYLLNENVGHIAYVISRILELLPQYHINSPEFRQEVQAYFRDRTEHFLHELYCFASTPYDLTGYDRNVQYTTDTRISALVNEVLSSSESEASVDSDIVMVSSSGPAEPPPGPSRLPAPVYPQNYIPQPTTTTDNVITIETFSQSDTDDDDEVMVVGYIKPPQDRTPEVVDLLGSDSDVIVQENTSPPEPEPEPQAHGSQGPESRAVPLVKLLLKRHAQRGGSDSDSDDPSPHRRPHSATTSDTCRTTPSPRTPCPATPATPATPTPTPGTPDWERSSAATTTTTTTTFTSCSSSSMFTCKTSSSDTETSSYSDSSSDRKKRPSRRKKLKRRRDVGSGGDRRKSKTRKSRPRHRRQTQVEKDKLSKRKSNSGKGVKSTKSSVPAPPPPVPQHAPSQDQPGPSGGSLKYKSNKSRKRRRQTPTRESKRLKSVVNVMYNQNKSGESSSSGTISNTLSSAVVNVSAGSDNMSTLSLQSELSNNTEVPSTSHKKADNSDSEDDLPLNLSVQKTYLSL